MALGSIAASVAAKMLIGFFVKEGWLYVKGTATHNEYENELEDIIYKTQEEYIKENPIKEREGKIPFYQSKDFLGNLMLYRYSEDFDWEEVCNSLKKDSKILIPREGELNRFFTIFQSKLENSKKLKGLHIDVNYTKEIFNVSDKLDEYQRELRSILPELDTKLLQEYKEQIQRLRSKLSNYKSKTVLDDVIEMEKRALDKGVEHDILYSKIEHLKGQCKRDLKYPANETAEHFIKSYKLNQSDPSLKEMACLEYFNIGENHLCISLADEILVKDDFNISAWIAKSITSDNILSFLKTVPTVVKKNNSFKMSIASWLINKQYIQSLTSLSDYGIDLDLTIVRYKKITYTNKDTWCIQAHFLLNQLLSDLRRQYVTGAVVILTQSKYFKSTLKLYSTIIETLKGTEIYKYQKFERFYYRYLYYWSNPTKENANKTLKQYRALKAKTLTDTVHIVQILNHNNNFDKSLEIIQEFEKKNKDNISPEIYLFKTVVYREVNETKDTCKLFREFVDAVKIVNDTYFVNLIQVFVLCLIEVDKQGYSDDELLKEIDYILEGKKFEKEENKKLFEIILKARFIASSDKNSLRSQLILIKDNYGECSQDVKFNLSETLYLLGCWDESLEYDSRYLNKKILSPELRVYILKSFDRLHKADIGRFSSDELLMLLEKWRIESKFPDLQLLSIEHNLYLETSNDQKVLEIAEGMYFYYPKNEMVVQCYLQALYKVSDIPKISEISDEIESCFRDENVGLFILGVLLRTRVNEDKSFSIAYNLASNPNNKRARLQYFTNENYFDKSRFQSPQEVTFGDWVEYIINDSKKDIKRVDENANDIIKECLGKKVGDEVIITSEVFAKQDKLRIISIMNDARKLTRDIIEEAHDPFSGSLMKGFTLDTTSGEGMIDQLSSLFREDKSLIKVDVETLLRKFDDYNTSFSELARNAFQDDYIATYDILTHDPNNFRVLPSVFLNNQELQKSLKFVLDFTSVQHFFYLERDLQLKFEKNEFIVSPKLVEEIKNSIKVIESKDPFQNTHIVMKSINPVNYPDNYRDKKVELLNSILSWIETNCYVDNAITEKLDLLLSLDSGFRKDLIFKLLLDHASLLERENYFLVTNDILFLRTLRNFMDRVTTTEVFLNKIYPEHKSIELDRYLLKKRYLGLTFTSKLLMTEFLNRISGKENYYNRCLLNLDYELNDPNYFFREIIKFLKDLYLMKSIKTEDKERYAQEVLVQSLRNTNIKIRDIVYQNIQKEFNLMGRNLNSILMVFEIAEKILYKD